MSKWFRGFRLKMLSLIGVSAGILVLLSGFSIYQLQTANEKINFLNTVRIPLTANVNVMDAQSQAIARYLWVANGEFSDEGTAAALKRVEQEVKEFEQAKDFVLTLAMHPDLKAKFDVIVAKWPAYKEVVQKVSEIQIKNTDEANLTVRKMLITEVRVHQRALNEAIDDLNKLRAELTIKDNNEVQAAQEKAQMLMIAFSAIALLGIGITGFLIATRVASVLTEVIQNLSHHSKEVSQASEGLSTAASSLSTGATETASSLEETVASTEELNSMVKNNADNARTAASLASEGRANAEMGEKNISQLYEAVGDVSKSSKEIEQIISVIDDIAFQTNLLALNAAVEAARAGEQGKGFAVVAEAVRTLAQKSAEAAKDISRLIVDSVDKTERSRELAEKSKESLAQIVTSIHKISDINAEIATASNEQATGLTNIAKAMNEIDRATQQNAASSEEISATSEEMTSQSVSLEKLVSELVVLVEGGDRTRASFEASMQNATSSKANGKANRSEEKTAIATVHQLNPNAKKANKSKQQQLEEILPLESGSDRKVSKVEGF